MLLYCFEAKGGNSFPESSWRDQYLNNGHIEKRGTKNVGHSIHWAFKGSAFGMIMWSARCNKIGMKRVLRAPRSFISVQFLFSILSKLGVANDSHIDDWCYLTDPGLDWTEEHQCILTYRASQSSRYSSGVKSTGRMHTGWFYLLLQ